MSNRYLFRGKRVDSTMNNGKFVEGFVVKGDHTTWIFTGNVDHGGLYPSWDKYVVDPETVGQCCWTLKDGINVFKGDRVKVKGTKRVGIYETEIIEDSQGFTLQENKTYYKDNSCFIAIIEVIHD
tara:strand:+ start:961 stop:1335 length:375 start_codon:yes stop_codon:yes gene_type:complete